MIGRGSIRGLPHIDIHGQTGVIFPLLFCIHWMGQMVGLQGMFLFSKLSDQNFSLEQNLSSCNVALIAGRQACRSLARLVDQPVRMGPPNGAGGLLRKEHLPFPHWAGLSHTLCMQETQGSSLNSCCLRGAAICK